MVFFFFFIFHIKHNYGMLELRVIKPRLIQLHCARRAATTGAKSKVYIN